MKREGIRVLKNRKERREGVDVDTHTDPPHVGSSSVTETVPDLSGPR